jgi:hypothetical protein
LGAPFLQKTRATVGACVPFYDSIANLLGQSISNPPSQAQENDGKGGY